MKKQYYIPSCEVLEFASEDSLLVNSIHDADSRMAAQDVEQNAMQGVSELNTADGGITEGNYGKRQWNFLDDMIDDI